MLCQRFEAAALNKDMCGYVYKNPQGAAETKDEYIVSMPASLRYFTVTQ
jgi:hypothetical protein